MSRDFTATQRLFCAVSPDGFRYEFVTLNEDACAILRDGKVYKTYGVDVQSINRAVDHFVKLSEHGSPHADLVANCCERV